MIFRTACLVVCFAMAIAGAGCAHPHRLATYRLQQVNGVQFVLPPSIDALSRQTDAPNKFSFECSTAVQQGCNFSSELFELKSVNGRCELAQSALAKAALYDPDSYDPQVQRLRKAGSNCVDTRGRNLSRFLVENVALPQDSMLVAFYGFHVGSVDLVPPMKLVVDRYSQAIDPGDPKSLESVTTSYEVSSDAQGGISLAPLSGGPRDHSASEDSRLKEVVGRTTGAKLFYREVAKGGYERSKRPFLLVEKADSTSTTAPHSEGAGAANSSAPVKDSRCAQMADAGERCIEFDGNVTARVEIPVFVNGTRKYFALGATVEHASYKLISSMSSAHVRLFRLYNGRAVEVRTDDPKAVLSLPLVDGDRIEVRKPRA